MKRLLKSLVKFALFVLVSIFAYQYIRTHLLKLKPDIEPPTLDIVKSIGTPPLPSPVPLLPKF